MKLIPGLKEAGEKSIDFATATERLNEQVRGQADAWAQTDEGKLARMNIQWDEMQESIGSALLPVMGKLLGIVTGVFDWFNSLDEGTQQLIITIGLAVAGLYVGVTAFNAVRLAVTTLGISMQTAMPWLIGITVAVAAVTAAVMIFGDEETDTEKAVKSMSKSVAASASSFDIQRFAMLDAADAAREFGESLYAEADKRLRDLIAKSPGMVKAMQVLGISMDEVTAASHDQAKATELSARMFTYLEESGEGFSATAGDLAGDTADLEGGMANLAVAITSSGEAATLTAEQNAELAKTGDTTAIMALIASGNFDLLTESEQAAANAALDAKAAAAEQKGGLADLGDETEMTWSKMIELVDATGELRKAFDEILGPTMDLEQADRRLRDATQDTTDTIIENGATLDINTEAGRKNRDTVQSQVDAMLGQAEAMVRSGSTTAEATAFVNGHREALRTQLEMLGLTESEIDAYLTTLGLTPENVSTSLELTNTETVKTQLEGVLGQLEGVDKGAEAEIKALIDQGQFDEAANKINALPGHHTVLIGVASDGSGVTLNANNGGSFRLFYREAGGPVTKGVPYVVGEKRAELFVPDVNGWILPEVPGVPVVAEVVARRLAARSAAFARRPGDGRRRTPTPEHVLPHRELPHGRTMTCSAIIQLVRRVGHVADRRGYGVRQRLDLGDAATEAVAADATETGRTARRHDGVLRARAVTLGLTLFPRRLQRRRCVAVAGVHRSRLRPYMFVQQAAECARAADHASTLAVHRRVRCRPGSFGDDHGAVDRPVGDRRVRRRACGVDLRCRHGNGGSDLLADVLPHLPRRRRRWVPAPSSTTATPTPTR